MHGILILTVVVLLTDNFYLYGSNHLEYWQWTGERKERFENKFSLNALFGDFFTGLQFHIFEPSEVTASSRREGVSKRFIEYRGKYFNIRVGNHYGTFGRGLVLRTYEDDRIELDQDLDGVKVSTTMDKFDFTILSGRPKVIFEHEIINYTTDIIRGASFVIRPIHFVNLGTNYMRLNREDIGDQTKFRKTEIMSGVIETSVLGIDLYCEYARRWGWDEIDYQMGTGKGLYFSSSLSMPGFGLTFEYKDYDKLGVAVGPLTVHHYNTPPCCNHSGRSIDNARDERGYQIDLSMSPNALILIEASYSNAKAHDKSKGVNEFYASLKFESYQKGLLALSLDWLDLTKIELPINNKTEALPMVEVAYYIDPQNTIKLTLEYKAVREDLIFYKERGISLAYSRAPFLTLGLIVRDTNQEDLEKNLWVLGELSWDITQKHNLRVRIGSEKGGIICSGGICRYEPPFEGIKLVLASMF